MAFDDKFNNDGEALQFLESVGYQIVDHGCILGMPGRPVTAEEDAAIKYLCEEWDYQYVDPDDAA
jgi:hypothetical protein